MNIEDFSASPITINYNIYKYISEKNGLRIYKLRFALALVSILIGRNQIIFQIFAQRVVLFELFT